jgi:hypothetical protein
MYANTGWYRDCSTIEQSEYESNASVAGENHSTRQSGRIDATVDGRNFGVVSGLRSVGKERPKWFPRQRRISLS